MCELELLREKGTPGSPVPRALEAGGASGMAGRPPGGAGMTTLSSVLPPLALPGLIRLPGDRCFREVGGGVVLGCPNSGVLPEAVC